jgi:hypothetical protein
MMRDTIVYLRDMSPGIKKQSKRSKAERYPDKQNVVPRSTRKQPSSKANAPSPPADEPSAPAAAASGAASAPSLPGTGARSALDVWRDEAMRLPAGVPRPRVPLHVLLDEAVSVARFFESHYPTLRNEDGTVARIGLDSVARPGRDLTASTAAEVLSLREAIHEAQVRYVEASAPRPGPPLARMRFVLKEIRGALGFLLDDGKRDVRDVQLEQLEASGSGSPRSTSALILALYQLATFANTHRAELDGLGGFDAALIDEAFALVDATKALPPVVPLAELPSDVLDLRNRLAMLLAARMSVVRAAARFVFRASPAIVREATSTYERRRAVAARRAKHEKKADSDAPPPATAGGRAPRRSPRSGKKPT